MAGENPDDPRTVLCDDLLARMAVGTAIHLFDLQVFFGADAYTYDELGRVLAQVWAGDSGYISYEELFGPFLERNYGMTYVVAVIYTHSHRDHYGGVRGVITLSTVASVKSNTLWINCCSSAIR